MQLSENIAFCFSLPRRCAPPSPFSPPSRAQDIQEAFDDGAPAQSSIGPEKGPDERFGDFDECFDGCEDSCDTYCERAFEGSDAREDACEERCDEGCERRCAPLRPVFGPGRGTVVLVNFFNIGPIHNSTIADEECGFST